MKTGFMKIIQAITGHFRTCGDEISASCIKESVFSYRNFAFVLLVWMFIWTVWPSLCVGNVFIDVAENIAWGSNFQFGYDKNPYFGAWFSYGVFRICPSEYVFYLMSQLSVFLGLSALYFLTMDVTGDRFAAFVAGMIAMLIPFFSHSACEFNDDVMSIAFWGLSALCFYRSVSRDSWKYWIATGFFFGLALMTKYLAGALMLPLGILLLITKEGRKCWKRPGLYLAMAVFLLLTLPNLIWLYAHDFIAIFYACRRAGLDSSPISGGWIDHVSNACSPIGDFLTRLILPAVALLLLRRGPKKTTDPFGQKVILYAALGPLALSALFALVTGGNVLVSWLTPYFVFATPLMVLWYRPVPERFTFKFFTGFVIVAATLAFLAFGFEYLHKRPYLKQGGYNVWPGRLIADQLTRNWHGKYGTPIPYVIGDRKKSCNFVFYSPDRPVAFFDHSVELSPWIDPADVKKRGAVILWNSETPPSYLEFYTDQLVMLPDIETELAGVGWYRKLAGPLRLVTVHAAFLPPEEARSVPAPDGETPGK